MFSCLYLQSYHGCFRNLRSNPLTACDIYPDRPAPHTGYACCASFTIGNVFLKIDVIRDATFER
jgi:hypothetical protein